MEYTKDIILNINCKGESGKSQNNWTSNIKKKIKENKFIISIVTATIFFIICDIVLVNNFIVILSRI